MRDLMFFALIFTSAMFGVLVANFVSSHSPFAAGAAATLLPLAIFSAMVTVKGMYKS